MINFIFQACRPTVSVESPRYIWTPWKRFRSKLYVLDPVAFHLIPVWLSLLF